MVGIKEQIMEVGGKQYPLILSYNAICEFDTGIGSATTLLRGTADAKNFIAYRGLFWAAANEYARVHEEPDKRVTVLQAGDICEQFITEKGIEPFIMFMRKLQKESGWLDGKKDEEKNGTPGPEV